MFIRSKKNPVITRKPGTFHSIHAANPDLLEFNGKILMYFRGQGDELHDQIGVAFTDPHEFDGIHWHHYHKNPVIKVSIEKSGFDCRHILDPAAVVFNNKVYLYYSGHSYDRPAGIGLAVSENGLDFTKVDSNPVVPEAIAPEIIYKEGRFFLFYQRKVEDRFEFFCNTSNDGINFDPINEKNVFGPSKDNSFDSFSITTCRIWQEDDIYYMTYGGCDRYADYPVAFGLAKSSDLLNWERYPGNPILNRGEAGQWDEGAVWFATVYNAGCKYYLWYEGTGTGLGTETDEAKSISDICRNEDYGSYARHSFSQIGLAVFSGNIPSW